MTALTEPQLDCQDLVELLTEYLDATLDPLLRRSVDEHLATCQGCEVYLDQLRRSRSALAGLGAAEKPALPAALLAGLLTAFEGLRR